jgi:hypothetical protein
MQSTGSAWRTVLGKVPRSPFSTRAQNTPGGVWFFTLQAIEQAKQP